ncbi:Sugar transporter [Zostera marina]|uniref:Sugar transporter n=1 Tax=Zostera marina TaxID=29655 RepID=A0A0K9PBP9_ZOSMR|nr:Sugar transporter [Zostera marina]
MPWRFGSSAYKRMASKDLTPVISNGVPVHISNGTTHENMNPSWRRSFPHICVAIISSFLFGYHMGVVNEPLEYISIDLGFRGNILAEGLVVSICLGGAFIGCMFSGWIADGVGRRRAFQLSAFPMVLGPPISAISTTLGGMLFGRFLVGIGMGLGPPIASLYVAEISPSFVRGTYGSFIQLATCLGIIGALLIGIPVKSVPGWWRVCFWASTLPAILLAVLMQFCAESPLWLYKRGKVEEAEVEFERLLGVNHVKSALADLTRSDRGDASENVKYSDLFYGHHFRVVFIGSMLYAFQQLSGINAVFFFSSTIFRSAGVPPAIANICVGITNLLGSIAAMILMDRLGRKLLLLGSFIGMAFAMIFQASASKFDGKMDAYFSVGGMLMFVLSFALGAGPVPGLLLAEIFPNKIRAKAMAVCMCVHWVVNFCVGLFFLELLDKLGSMYLYTIFSSLCLLAALFVKRNVVETKGKSLQEIEISLLQYE